MPTKSKAKLRSAVQNMYKTLEAFRDAKYEFARLIYESGHQDKESFCAAVKEAISELGKPGGNINYRKDEAIVMDFFIPVVNNHKRRSGN